jgi:hypothetical protein
MIDTNAVGSDFDVKKSDLADQRLLSLIFAPGANDFHKDGRRAKLMPIVVTPIIEKTRANGVPRRCSVRTLQGSECIEGKSSVDAAE